MNEPAQRCEEQINYHLSAILTDTEYTLWKCGVVCELCLTGSESCLSGEKKSRLASTGGEILQRTGGEILQRTGGEILQRTGGQILQRTGGLGNGLTE